MKEYAYEELAAAATRHGATQEEINALGEWFEQYGQRFWNGSSYEVDEKKDIYLAPIMREVEEDEYEIIGYTFSHETITEFTGHDD